MASAEATRVGGPASVFQYSSGLELDVAYGWNLSVEIWPVLMGPELDWGVSCLPCHRKGVSGIVEGWSNFTTHPVKRARGGPIHVLPPVVERDCS
jgi:hypothetical protein